MTWFPGGPARPRTVAQGGCPLVPDWPAAPSQRKKSPAARGENGRGGLDDNRPIDEVRAIADDIVGRVRAAIVEARLRLVLVLVVGLAGFGQ